MLMAKGCSMGRSTGRANTSPYCPFNRAWIDRSVGPIKVS